MHKYICEIEMRSYVYSVLALSMLYECRQDMFLRSAFFRCSSGTPSIGVTTTPAHPPPQPHPQTAKNTTETTDQNKFPHHKILPIST